jgi:hypothetical protein
MVAQTQTIYFMKNLLECSIDELLTERQNAIESDNLDRYRECNELISTWSANTAKKLDIVEMYSDLKNESKLNSFESTLGQAE